MTIHQAIVLRIREICAENHMTLNKLSTQCGITQSTLNNIISGRNKSTTASTIQKICDGVNITVRDFYASPVFDDIEPELR